MKCVLFCRWLHGQRFLYRSDYHYHHSLSSPCKGCARKDSQNDIRIKDIFITRFLYQTLNVGFYIWSYRQQQFFSRCTQQAVTFIICHSL